MPRGKKTRAQVSAEPSMGPDRSGKTPEDLEEDVKTMADKAGIKMPKDEKKKEEEVVEALKHTRPTPSRSYSKQQALEELKEEHGVTKPKEKGDPCSIISTKPTRSKRGMNLPPSEEEKEKPPTKRRTSRGNQSERGKLEKEENRALADAMYELADYTLHGDDVQKGIHYQKAAKSIRTAPFHITSGQEAQKLPGIGKSTSQKIQEFLDSGKIGVLEEYKSGQRGL